MTVQDGRTPGHGRFVVRAEKWSGGWDLLVHGELMPGGGVTQVTRLVDAEQRVREYLRTVYDRDFSHAEIEIVADAPST
jgi:hypothetical protein